jgi:hypothetical protein
VRADDYEWPLSWTQKQIDEAMLDRPDEFVVDDPEPKPEKS